MVKALINLVSALVVMLIVVMILGALGMDPRSGFRRLFFKEQEIAKQTAEERREVRKESADANAKTCFAHQVWHAAWLNSNGNKTTALLVAVATRNVKETAPTDYCSIFTTGMAELPDVGKRTPETKDSYITRNTEIVSGQSSTKARTAQYDEAEQVMEVVLKAADHHLLLPPELKGARCARKYLRARFGWLIGWTAGKRENIRNAIIAQYGEPVYRAPDGMEFFGKCP